MKKMRTIAALITIGACLVACGKQLSSEEYIQRAQAQLADGKVAAATIELKNAVNADAGNALARLLLGSTYFSAGDVQGAVKELRKAHELGAAPDEVLPLLAQALLLDDARDELARIELDDLSPASRATVLAAQALGKASDGKLPDANDLILTALEANPDSVYALTAHARLLLGTRSVAPARAELERALELDPRFAPAWSTLGDLEIQEHRFEQAEEAFGKAIELQEFDFADRLKRTLLRFDMGKFDDVRQDVVQLKKMAPQHLGVAFAEGVLQLHDKQLDAARVSLEKAAEADRVYPLSLYMLAGINLEQGNLAQADSYARRFVERAPGNINGRKLAASLQLRAGDFARAERYLRPVVASGSDDIGALNLMANALIAQGKTQEGLEILKRVAELEPDSAKAQTRLAAGLLSTGDATLGTERLQEALRLDPSFQQADILLVLGHLRDKDFPAAIAAAEDYRQRHPDEPGPYNLLALAQLASGDRDQAEASFKKVLEVRPGEPQASHALAAMAQQNKDFDAARAYYDGVLAQHADHLPTLMKLAALAEAQQDEAGMLQALERAIKAHPDAIEPRLALARVQLRKGDLAAATSVLNELDVETRKQPGVLELLSTIQLAQRDFTAARTTLLGLVEARPGYAPGYLRLADAYGGLGDVAQMRSTLEKAIEVAPQYLPARIALARLLYTQRDIVGMEQQVGEMTKLQPANPDVLLLESTLAAVKGDPKRAIAKSEEAFKVQPGTVTVIAYAQQLAHGGQQPRALQLLNDWVKEHGEDIPVRLSLGDTYLASGDKAKAMAYYAEVLELAPDHVGAMNNLAWLKADEDPAEALKLARRASELSPKVPAVLDTLALVQLRSGDRISARKTVDEARKLDPDNPSLRFREAQIREAAGDKAGAIELLRPLVADEETRFSERDEAHALLQKLEP